MRWQALKPSSGRRHSAPNSSLRPPGLHADELAALGAWRYEEERRVS